MIEREWVFGGIASVFKIVSSFMEDPMQFVVWALKFVKEVLILFNSPVL